METRMRAVLDVVALIATYPPEGRVLAEYTIATAIEYLQRRATAQDVGTLLELARLLGYVSDDLVELHRKYLDEDSVQT